MFSTDEYEAQLAREALEAHKLSADSDRIVVLEDPSEGYPSNY